jgi:hypothetical protein
MTNACRASGGGGLHRDPQSAPSSRSCGWRPGGAPARRRGAILRSHSSSCAGGCPAPRPDRGGCDPPEPQHQADDQSGAPHALLDHPRQRSGVHLATARLAPRPWVRPRTSITASRVEPRPAAFQENAVRRPCPRDAAGRFVVVGRAYDAVRHGDARSAGDVSVAWLDGRTHQVLSTTLVVGSGADRRRRHTVEANLVETR